MNTKYDLSRDDDPAESDVKTVPPPGGSPDAYGAQTVVKAVPKDLLAAVRIPNLGADVDADHDADPASHDAGTKVMPDTMSRRAREALDGVPSSPPPAAGAPAQHHTQPPPAQHQTQPPLAASAAPAAAPSSPPVASASQPKTQPPSPLRVASAPAPMAPSSGSTTVLTALVVAVVIIAALTYRILSSH